MGKTAASGQCFVRSIAKRRVFRVLALTPVNRFFLQKIELHWLQARSLVRAIAERLVRGATARTPPMNARFHFQSEGFTVTNNRLFSHARNLAQGWEFVTRISCNSVEKLCTRPLRDDGASNMTKIAIGVKLFLRKLH